jgi:tRNA dimethylallyltransferase
MLNTLPPVLFLLGPTASGKTALACRIIDALRPRRVLEIVSVDSALVYRDMNIGTAKPDAAMLARYPHRLIDLIAPNEAYSAADFRRDALAAIAEIHARGATPLLVGGTMMYVKSLIGGLSILPPADPGVRSVLEAEAAVNGWPAMHARLALVDPITAVRLSPNDSQRIQRALEVYEITGLPMSQLHQRDAAPGAAGAAKAFPYASHLLALIPSDRSVLHTRIAARFAQMLEGGLVEEVRALKARYPLSGEMPSMRAVGYRQVWQMLNGEIDAEAMYEQGIAATRQLAKRQLTWLRSMDNVESFDCLDAAVSQQVEQRVRAILGAL